MEASEKLRTEFNSIIKMLNVPVHKANERSIYVKGYLDCDFYDFILRMLTVGSEGKYDIAFYYFKSYADFCDYYDPITDGRLNVIAIYNPLPETEIPPDTKYERIWFTKYKADDPAFMHQLARKLEVCGEADSVTVNMFRSEMWEELNVRIRTIASLKRRLENTIKGKEEVKKMQKKELDIENFAKGNTLFAEEGEWLNNDYWNPEKGGRFSINYSSILSFLIKEAGRYCDHYASDLFITWEGLVERLTDPNYNGEKLLFGFRESGVDSNTYVLSNYNQGNTHEYMKLYVLDVSVTLQREGWNIKRYIKMELGKCSVRMTNLI